MTKTRRTQGAAVLGIGLWGTLSGCARVDEGLRYDERCLLRVHFRPELTLARTDLTLTRKDVEHPELIGSWDGFARPGHRRFDEQFSLQGTRYFTLALPLAPGRYRYGFLVGDELLTDDLNPHSEFAAHPLWSDSTPYEAEWSVTDLTDCRLARLDVAQLATEDSSSLDAKDGRLRVEFRLVPGVNAAQLATDTVQVLYNGQPLTDVVPTVSRPSGELAVVELRALQSGKYQVTLSGNDPLSGSPLRATAQAVIAPRRTVEQPSVRSDDDRLDTVLYHVLIDRFRGPSGALSAPSQPGRRAGGTLSGVMAAIDAGYFDALGVTTLWLSPLYQNAPGLQLGRDGNYYESYHGYWPTEPRSVEPKLGTPQELTELSQRAHRHGLRVIFDAVPNHVFSGHPYYRDHGRSSPSSQPDPLRKSWFSDGPRACVCGTTGCGWGERIEDCWFDSFLPDVNLRNPEAASQQRDDLLWWLQRFDLDGMRIDAVPMMPRGFTRDLVRAVTAQAQRGGLDWLIIGENYTGPGDGGRFEIRSFLGDRFFGLHSAFDFPLFWATVDALAKDRIPLTDLEQQVALSQKVYGGSGAVMAHILNNHDTARFVSEAAGNAGNHPWTAPPPQPTDPEPYQRHMLALTLLLTMPGMPVLYYGDEVGLAGAGDPDSRRVLPDVMTGRLPSQQQQVLQHVQKLGQLRRCLTAIRRGTRKLLQAGSDFSIALHEQSGHSDVAISVLSRSQGERLVTVRGLPSGRYRDVLHGETLVVRDGVPAGITLRALRSAVFVSEGSRCQ
ncbi:MAG: hypothetical protein JNM40_21285 [Myxococcales bacterium]|nr:hypothetical protein [Myxococcales bacterium]